MKLFKVLAECPRCGIVYLAESDQKWIGRPYSECYDCSLVVS